MKATRVCSVDLCDRPAKTRDWCQAHYMRWYATGDVRPAEPLRPARRAAGCSVEGCARKHDGHGFCSMHLKRWHRDGDLGRGRPAGEQHHRWAGAELTYAGAHSRVNYQRGPAAEYGCAHCSCPAEQWAYDHADPNELVAPNPRNGVPMPYSADPAHYVPLCQPCHGAFDRSRKAAA